MYKQKNAPIEAGTSDQGARKSDYDYSSILDKISQAALWVSRCNLVQANLIMVINFRSISVHNGSPGWFMTNVKGIPNADLRNAKEANKGLDAMILVLKEMYEDLRCKTNEADWE